MTHPYVLLLALNFADKDTLKEAVIARLLSNLNVPVPVNDIAEQIYGTFREQPVG
jgi:hypothetical protein